MNDDAPQLLCTVRGCRSVLQSLDRRLVCARGHSFDIARSGYINLLQPQERRSKEPGDSVAAVAARRRLHDRGITEPLLNGIESMLSVGAPDVLLDVGCGVGYYAGEIARQSGCLACGVDISTAAIDAAARRYPVCQWIVANADRVIPYADMSFTAIMSVTARMSSVEFRRVIRPEGRLLVAVAAPEDLIELRGLGRNRMERTAATFASEFRLLDHKRLTTTAAVDEEAVRDFRLAIYRPFGASDVEQVTLSLDLLLFEPV